MRPTGARRRAAVVEPQVLQRSGTTELLHRECAVDVVFTADAMPALMTWMRVRDRPEWPHLLVVDPLALDGGDRDRAAIAALREAGMRVLLLSALRPRLAAQRIVGAGVDGVASKYDDEATLVTAVLATLAGHRPFTARAAQAMQLPSGSPRLSAQELRALELYAAGRPIEEVAESIGVRPDTARKYLSRVKDKYAAIGRPAPTRLELAYRAWQDGIAG